MRTIAAVFTKYQTNFFRLKYLIHHFYCISWQFNLFFKSETVNRQKFGNIVALYKTVIFG